MKRKPMEGRTMSRTNLAKNGFSEALVYIEFWGVCSTYLLALSEKHFWYLRYHVQPNQKDRNISEEIDILILLEPRL